MAKKTRTPPVKLLEDEYPTHYLPHVGRQVMQQGGSPDIEGDVSFAPDDMQTDAARIEEARRIADEAARRQAREAYAVSPVVDMNLDRSARYAARENAPRAMPTASEFVQRELKRGEPQLPQYDQEAEERWKEGAKGVAHMAAYGIPVIGEALGAYDMANALRNVASPDFRKAISSGDYATTAGGLADLGLSAFGIPGKAAKAAAAAGALLMPDDAGATFIGEAANLTPSLRRALELSRKYLNVDRPQDVWRQYDWAPDPSGRMVSELSDEGARLIPQGLARFRTGETMSLGDILSHPEVYDRYPSSYTTKVAPYLPKEEGERGYYSPLQDYIGVNERLGDRQMLDTLLHEHQHRIQNIEGMSPGARPEMFKGPEAVARPHEERLSQLLGAMKLQEIMRENPGIDPLDAKVIAGARGIPIVGGSTHHTHKGAEELAQEAEFLRRGIDDIYATHPTAHEQYLRTLGEWSARLPGERLELTAPERRVRFPFDPNYPVNVLPVTSRPLGNLPGPRWENERERAIELARQLRREPLPPKPRPSISPEQAALEEDMMRFALEAEARKRAGVPPPAFGPAPLPTIKKAGGGPIAKLLGKLLPEGSGYVPRKGFPGVVNLPGIGRVEPRPIEPIEAVSRRFAGPAHDTPVAPINPEFSERVAREYEDMRHAPKDPVVRRAFEALADETMAQYRAARDLGLDIRFLKPGQADPYAASPGLGYEDIVNRGRLFVFPTEQGFGSTGGLNATNVLLKGAGQVGDKPDAVVNDAFRVIHDLYGHFGPGNPFFRAPGEERAYQLHKRMFSPEAVPALASETRGQNSWVNFGPMAERNRAASGAETHYADQKTGVMAPWATEEPPPVGADIEQFIRERRQGGGKVGIVEAAIKAAAPFVDRTLLPHSDVIRRVPELAEAFKAGVRGPEYQALVDRFKPVREWADVPAPATAEDILGALRPGQRLRVGAGENIEAGTPVGLRLDIPAYARHGVWVPTIHEAGAKGRPIAHEATARISGATFGFNPRDAASVAQGGAKFPFAKIEGKWTPEAAQQTYEAAKEYLRSKDWRQIGMDPERHAYFYDRGSQEPIIGAEDVMQVGPLVLGKNPIYGKRSDFEYAAGGRAKYEGGGKAALIGAALKAAEEFIPYTKRMFFTHNIDPLNLKKATETGGLPAPSIAASMPTTGDLSDFGPIALVGKPEKFRPTPEAPVYGQDVWSPRVPGTREYGRTMFSPSDPNAFEGRGFFSMLHDRPMPATMENILAEMKARPVIGGEYMLPGTKRPEEMDIGYLISAFAPRFKTMQELQGARGRLVPSGECGQRLLDVSKEHQELADVLSRGKSSEEYLSNALFDAIEARRKALPGQKGTPFFSQIKSYYPEISPAQEERVARHVTSLAEMPAKYFEAKPMRPVSLSDEFAGAAIPASRASELGPLLERAGIRRIEKYDPVRSNMGTTIMERFPEAGFASGGIVPRADDDQFFRRMALWTYAVAPLFAGPQDVRRHGFAGGGKIIEQAIKAAKLITSEGKPTVRGMVNEAPLFPDVYKNPRLLAEEAESRVAPEDPLLKRLWGVTREDMFNIAGSRPGNREPVLAAGSANPRGVNYAAESVMVPENAERLQSILEEGRKQPGLRTGMMPWYYMDPVHARLEQMFDPDEARNRYNLLNTSIAMMSPASSVPTEINRGLGAYHLALQGRFDDFVLGGGKPSQAPQGVMPPYMRERMLGHKVHSTSQAGPLTEYMRTGVVDMGSPKVPLYIQSSGVPATGFQTRLPVPDAHYTRILGMPDVRKTADPAVSMKMNEYRPVGPWFREEVARPLEMEAVPAQALLWGTGSGATGVDSPIGAPKLEMLSRHIGDVARHYRVSPETARDLILQGTLYSSGGSVINRALDVVSNLPRHQVEPGTPG